MPTMPGSGQVRGKGSAGQEGRGHTRDETMIAIVRTQDLNMLPGCSCNMVCYFTDLSDDEVAEDSESSGEPGAWGLPRLNVPVELY